MNTNLDQHWSQWIETETRRRLMAAYFVLDVHKSMYYEQPLTLSFDAPKSSIPLTTSTEARWIARSAEAWSHASALGSTNRGSLILCEIIKPDRIENASHLDLAVFLAAEVLRLPKRAASGELDVSTSADQAQSAPIKRLFPDSTVASTYLALHYTPLRDLLAVSGESWFFSQKVIPLQDFQQRQKRLKRWSGSKFAANAAGFAAEALLKFLDSRIVHHGAPQTFAHDERGGEATAFPESRSLTWNKTLISDYWAMYVCTLIICWAINHRTAKAPRTAAASASKKGAANAAAPHRADADDEESEVEAAAVFDWLERVTLLADENVPRVGEHEQMMKVVGMVRRRLELEAVGSKSILLRDALKVLKKLEKGDN